MEEVPRHVPCAERSSNRRSRGYNASPLNEVVSGMDKPLVDVLELDARSVMIGWYEVESREIVLTLVARMALRLADATAHDRMTLVAAWESVPGVSATSIPDFVARAPAVLCPELRYCSFELFVGARPIFEMSHLDQSIAGVGFGLADRDAPGDQFHALLRDSLHSLRAEHPEVDFILPDGQ